MSHFHRTALSLLAISALVFLSRCSGQSTVDSPEPWEQRREIQSFAVLGDTVIDAKLYSYAIEHKGSSGDEIHNRTYSYIRISRRDGSVGRLPPRGASPSVAVAAMEDPQLPGFLHFCSNGEIHNGRYPGAKAPPFECTEDGSAAAPGGVLAAFPTRSHGVMVFDTALLAVLELPQDTVLELDPSARTATTLFMESESAAVWRKYSISSQLLIDSARLTDPVLLQLEGVGVGLACSDVDAPAGKEPCRALTGVSGLRQAVRVHCRSSLCEWLPSQGELAILAPGNVFRFLNPSTGSSVIFDAGGLLLSFDPGK